MTLHADQAARWTRAAQIGAAGAAGLIALVVAGLIAFLPDPEDAVEVPEIQPIAVEAAPKPPPTAHFEHSDWKEVAPLLAWVAPDPAQLVTVPGDPKGPGPDPPPTAPDLLTWRYLGMVREQAAVYALVAVDGKQRFVWVGDKVGGGEIVAITPERLRVKINGREQEVVAAKPVPTIMHSTGAGPRESGVVPGPPGLSEERQAEMDRQFQEEAQRDRARRDAERKGRPPQ